MKCPLILANEPERLRALLDHGLHQPEVQTNLVPVVEIASRTFQMPIAAVNMIGSDHVFFVASTGTREIDTRREISFCAHAINEEKVMVVADATLDERFHDNPLVTGEPHMRFYAGTRLLSPQGLALGVLCIVDHQPHFDFSAEDQARLQALAAIVSDRLELRRIELMAQRTRPPFDVYAAHTSTPILWFDRHRQITHWNQPVSDLLAEAANLHTGLALERLFSSDSRSDLLESLASLARSHAPELVKASCKLRATGQGGTPLVLDVTLMAWPVAGQLQFEAVLNPTQMPYQHCATPMNLSHVMAGDAATQRHAATPMLNDRARFYRFVEQTLRARQAVTVYMLDLDSFKDINDTIGYRMGDLALTEVAHRLLNVIPGHGLVARMGADDFAVALPGLATPVDAMRLAESLLAHIRNPMLLQDQTVMIHASCGVALSPLHTLEALELVSDADLALFKAKAQGKGRASLFTPDLRQAALVRRQTIFELHRAVNEGEFVLFYQPQVSLNTGKIMGAEALIRWHHPQRGILPPVVFLSALQNGPLAVKVGSWVLDEACAQLAAWRRMGARHLRMGVNLFSAQFHSGDLVEEVSHVLARHGLPADALELEITENIALNQDEVVLSKLRLLRQMGVGIAFDDFGTGYASLSLLKTYPLTRIKIDKTFVNGMLQHKEDHSVVCATLDIAQGFDLQSIAEGIETLEQYDYLKQRHCDEGQGYLFGKPMLPEQFIKLIL